VCYDVYFDLVVVGCYEVFEFGIDDECFVDVVFFFGVDWDVL